MISDLLSATGLPAAPFDLRQQGRWSAAEYFALEARLGGGFRAELVDGHLEVLPMPKRIHQFIVGYLYRLLFGWVDPRQLGDVAFSGLRIRVANGANPKFRGPDVCFMKKEHAARSHEDFWEGADLAMEVVSEDPKDHERDYVIKPLDYAAAGIPEYWIIDPAVGRIRVLVLQGGAYQIHGDFASGQVATSVVLPGFTVSVDLALGGGKP